jgi:hypothetical protein
LIAESKFTCLTPAATRELRIEPDNQITADERMMVESKTRRAREVLNRLVNVFIVNYFDVLLYTQLHELLEQFQGVQDRVQFLSAIFEHARLLNEYQSSADTPTLHLIAHRG